MSQDPDNQRPPDPDQLLKDYKEATTMVFNLISTMSSSGIEPSMIIAALMREMFNLNLQAMERQGEAPDCADHHLNVAVMQYCHARSHERKNNDNGGFFKFVFGGGPKDVH